MIKKNIFWSITILCVWIIPLLPITAEGETWGEILTDEEKSKYEELWKSGVLHEGNIEQFFDRFERAPNRKNAFESALNTGFTGNVGRELVGIKRVFADPSIGAKAAQEHYREHGPVRGTVRIALSPVTIPLGSWGEIVGGEQGLGEYPLKILVGAASVILWGVLILSIQTKQTKYNYKAALTRFTIAISIIIFIVYSIIDGVVSGLIFVLYTILFLGIQYVIICLVLYPIILGVYHYVILWIYRGLKG